MLYNIDLSIFNFINQTLSNPVTDAIMPIITNGTYWIPVWALLILLIIWKEKRRGIAIVLLLLLAVSLSDIISSRLIKHIIMRPRPCQTLSTIHLLIPCGGGKSFPSSHSVNFAVVATILSYFFKKYWVWAVSTAFIVGISRVFVGVHYPFDVLSGFAFGFAIGLAAVKATKIKTLSKYFIENKACKETENHSINGIS